MMNKKFYIKSAIPPTFTRAPNQTIVASEIVIFFRMCRTHPLH